MALTSPGIIKAANDILVQIAPEITMVKLFAFDASDAVADYGAAVQVPVAVGATADFSASNYEVENGSLTTVTVPLDAQPKCTFAINGRDKLELGNAPIWTRLAEAGKRGIATGLQKKIAGLISTSSFTPSSNVAFGAEGSVELTKSVLAKCRQDCKGRVGDTILALDPVRYAEALSLFDSSVYGGTEAVRSGVIPGLYGFKAVIQLDGMGAGVQGALIPADGVAVAVRAVAVGDESCYSEYGTVADENGFAVTVMRHGSPSTGKGFINVTNLIGAALSTAKENLVYYTTAKKTA